MKTFKHYLDLVEAENPNISYSRAPGKVTATVSGSVSGKFTKLAQNLARIDVISEELKQLQATVKQQRREDIAELFAAEDSVLTRVVETKSVVFTLSKDPAASETPKYKLILEELEKKLTPELLKVLTALKEEHVTITQKEPSLRYATKDPVDESTGTASELVSKVNRWLPKFDQRLDVIKSYI